jgi:hypothetical protein
MFTITHAASLKVIEPSHAPIVCARERIVNARRDASTAWWRPITAVLHLGPLVASV